jgi:phenylacetate-coenzyme A ligase PaaK-like adenylate-forming protein
MSSRLDPSRFSSHGQAPRLALVAATGGHFAGVAMMSRLLRIAPAMASRIRIFSILQPLPTLVEALNAFAPAVIATYPSAAESLADEQAKGRLKLELQAVWLGGEQLGKPLARQLAVRFGCDIRESYGASEFLSIAWSCAQGSLHVNSDWVVLEPVDSNMRAVEPGTASHTVLLTNLANHVQPLIRYDLGDSITQAGTPCPCGSVFPSIEVEGRHDDVLEFGNLTTRMRLLPLAIATLLEDEAGCFDFQLVRIAPQTLSLRLGPFEAASPGRRGARSTPAGSSSRPASSTVIPTWTRRCSGTSSAPRRATTA